MVECFELDEIRARIDELFDPVTMALVKCGQTCLRRLSSLLYIDVEQQINEVSITLSIAVVAYLYVNCFIRFSRKIGWRELNSKWSPQR